MSLGPPWPIYWGLFHKDNSNSSQEKRLGTENTNDTMHTRHRHQNGRHNSCLISNFLENRWMDPTKKAYCGTTSFWKQQNPTVCYLPEVYFRFSHCTDGRRMQRIQWKWQKKKKWMDWLRQTLVLKLFSETDVDGLWVWKGKSVKNIWSI